MNSDFLLVHRSILPSYFPRVIKARERIEKEGINVTQACKEEKISRSTYYKYKDYVYKPNRSSTRKAILSLKCEDIPGVLNKILNCIFLTGANILTISQDTPINGIAYIHLTINTKNMSKNRDELIASLCAIEHVKKAEVLAYE